MCVSDLDLTLLKLKDYHFWVTLVYFRREQYFLNELGISKNCLESKSNRQTKLHWTLWFVKLFINDAEVPRLEKRLKTAGVKRERRYDKKSAVATPLFPFWQNASLLVREANHNRTRKKDTKYSHVPLSVADS